MKTIDQLIAADMRLLEWLFPQGNIYQDRGSPFLALYDEDGLPILNIRTEIAA